MATIYDTLRLLAAYGWKTLAHDGHRRILTHKFRPGVLITLEGMPSTALDARTLRQILKHAGLDEAIG